MTNIKKQYWKKLFVSVILSFTVSVLLFLTKNEIGVYHYKDIDCWIYLAVVAPIVLCLLILYSVKKSKELYIYISTGFGTNFLFFIILKWLEGYRPCIDFQDILYILYSLALLISFILSNFLCGKKEGKVRQNYFKEREDDLSRIKNYLENFNKVGVISDWGNGKTFLCDMLMNDSDFLQKYYPTKIEVLSLKVDVIQSFIIKELNNILSKNRIFSFSSPRIQDLLKEEHWFSKILQFIFYSNESYSDSLEGIRQECKLINKKVVLIIEDLDRLNTVEEVQLLLDITEKLACDWIKIIFLFSEENLSEIKQKENNEIKFDHDFIEKYIPYTVKLTELNAIRIIDELIKHEQRFKFLKTEDFNFLQYTSMNSILSNALGVNKIIQCDPIGITIRRLEIFLDEICQNQEKLEKDKKVIITFFFMKHFYHNIYENIEISKSLLDQFIFIDEKKNKNYNIFSLIEEAKKNKQNITDINEFIFNNQDNVDKLVLLHFFGFNFDVYEKQELVRNAQEINTEDIKIAKRRHENERINRIIWHLYAAGKDKFSDYEEHFRNLNEMVLDVDSGDPNQLIDNYFHNMNTLSNDHIPVLNRIGISHWVSLFKLYRTVDIDKDPWKPEEKNDISVKRWEKLIDIYVNKKQKLIVDEECLEVFAYINLQETEIFLYACKKFLKFKIEKNYNIYPCFLHFLHNYIDAIGLLGFCRISQYFTLNDIMTSKKDNKLQITELLDSILKELEKKNSVKSLDILKNDRNVVIKFLSKLKELVNINEVAKKVGEIKTTTNITERYIHQDEIDRIMSLPKKSRKNEVIESYKKGKLYPIEMEFVLSNN